MIVNNILLLAISFYLLVFHFNLLQKFGRYRLSRSITPNRGSIDDFCYTDLLADRILLKSYNYAKKAAGEEN